MGNVPGVVPVEPIWLSWIASCARLRKPLAAHSRSSITSPAHGQNATPKAYPHLVTRRYLPSLTNTLVHDTSPGADTSKETGICCRLQCLQQSPAEQPHVNLRGALTTRSVACTLRHASFFPSHIILRLCCVLALGRSGCRSVQVRPSYNVPRPFRVNRVVISILSLGTRNKTQ